MSVPGESMAIAIVGMSARYPGAADLEQFWYNLRNGRNSVREIPAYRWDVNPFFDPDRSKKGKIYCKWLGALDNIANFDPLFFNIAPSEAEYIDPQHRLFLQEAYAAFENGAFRASSLAGKNCGVYLGLMSYEYGALIHRLSSNPSTTGNSFAIAAARLSYALDLKGPALALDTACSSSLVATHLACRALHTREIDMALVGGASLYLTPNSYLGLCGATMLSSDGRCKAFDDQADGFVPGEGVGAIVLKRCEEAEADGDIIHGIIIGSGINQDGKTNGITAPNRDSQIALETEVYERHRIDPDTITYAEAHGTGTRLGDPIELEALATALGRGSSRRQACAVGSVKTNIGHASAAAGIAGLHKVLLQLRHQELAPSLHFSKPNRHFDLERSPLVINTELKPWKTKPGTPRRACVSSFGFSGTNAHIVLEEYIGRGRKAATVTEASDPSVGAPMIIVISAKNAERLTALVGRLLTWVKSHPALDLRDFAYTLQVGREPIEERLAFLARSRSELINTLEGCRDGGSPSAAFRQRVKKGVGALIEIEINDNLHKFLVSLVSKEKYQELAQLWVQGVNVDWNILYGARKPNRICLPTYPFMETAYWLPGKETTTPPRLIQREQAILGGLAASKLGQGKEPTRRFTSTLSGEEFFLRDHVVDSNRILPGAAYLEMARAAVTEFLTHDWPATFIPLAFRNVIWPNPLVVGQRPETLHIDLVARDDLSVRFEAYGEMESGSRKLYCQGYADHRVDTLSASEIDGSVEDWAARCDLRRIPAKECYAYFREMGLEYGPGFQTLQEIKLGPGMVLADIALPASVADGADRYALHPNLLDAALQACVGLAWDATPSPRPPSSPMLPFGIEELVVCRACPPRIWARVRLRNDSGGPEHRKLDIDLCAADGTLCVSIRGFSLRAARPAADLRDRGEAGTLLLRPRWFGSPAAADPSSAGREPEAAEQVVLLCHVEGSGQQATASHLPRRQFVSLEPGGAAAGLDAGARFTFFATRVFEEIKSRFEAKTSAQLRLQVVTGQQGDHDLLGGLDGLLRTAELELPGFTGQLISWDGGGGDIAHIVDENARRFGDKRVRYRQASREVLGWEDASHELQQQSIPWRDDGVYLITGGAHGVGLLFAEEIVARAKRPRLILAGRSALSEEIAARIRHLEQAGGLPEYQQVDVTDRAAVERLVAGIMSEHGKLQGVIHAAGLIRDQILLRKSVDDFQAVLAPKVAGPVHLDRAIGDHPLDLFVLFSSIAALGNPGQADYATGNAFMDCFAAHRNAQVDAGMRRGITLSVNWPLWQNGGMTMGRVIQEQVKKRTGMTAMASARGIAAFYSSLASCRDQSLVLEGDMSKIRSAIFPKLPLAPFPRSPEVRQEPPFQHATPGSRSVGHVVELERVLGDAVSSLLRVERTEIDADAHLMEFGFDSISFTEFARVLGAEFDIDVDATIFFEYTTITSLARHLLQTYPRKVTRSRGAGPTNGADAPSVAVDPDPVSRDLPDRFKPPLLAVIGMSGCFPMAEDIEKFWENLRDERDCISQVPPARWNWQDVLNGPGSELAEKGVITGGFIDEIDAFDPLFFGIAPKEARTMDPQQRLLMTHVWKAIEDAGYAPSSLAGTRTGLFIGTGSSGYSAVLTRAGYAIEGYSSTGSTPSIGPNRMSYFLDLRGPSEPVETACSSSLVALHRAMEAISNDSCDMAIVGGVNTIVSPEIHLSFSKAGMLARDGRCKTFSDEADGYVRGEGAGIIVLKRIERAERDGDRIYGLIRSTAVNHGGRAASLTAPNPRAQADVIQHAFRRGGIDPRTVGYIEVHGTGTALGDPIEINGLKTAFREMSGPDTGAASAQFCGLGSVKTNIGHLELAAGIAGVIKVLLQLKHRTLAGSLHSGRLNPHLRLEGGPFYVVEEAKPWAALLDRSGRPLPRRAGVSSFGFGGVNAHAVIEEYVPPAGESSEPGFDAGPQIVVLSARDSERLRSQVNQLLAAIDSRQFKNGQLVNIAYTLQVGRDSMEERLAFTASSITELRRKLVLALEEDVGSEQIWRGHVRRRHMDRAFAQIAAALREQRHGDVLTWWVGGLDIKWDEHLWPIRPRRIGLPTYPFAKERYWPLKVAPSTEVEAPRTDARPAVAGDDRVRRVVRYLMTMLSDATELPQHRIDAHTPTKEYGVDSLMAVKLTDQLERNAFGTLPNTLFFEHRTLWDVAAFLCKTYPYHVGNLLGDSVDLTTEVLSPPQATPSAADPIRDRPGADAPIAVIALTGRYPQAKNVEEFWKNLCDGRDCITKAPSERWSEQAHSGADREPPKSTASNWGGFIDAVDRFDPLFFGISPRDARLMDPHDRLFLQTVWELLEGIGYTRAGVSKQYNARVGVFVGAMYHQYQALPASPADQALTSISSYWSIANRVSHFFDFRGPSLAVDTACSSGLIAVHLASESLRKGECGLAIAGAVNLNLHSHKYVGLGLTGVLGSSRDSRSFATGDGYLPAEAVGAVLLKPLDQAISDGDDVLAVIKTTAMNHGGRTHGFAVPSAEAQAQLLVDNFRRSGIDPRSISYVESAANGSAIGDPLELAGLVKAFRQFTQDVGFCAVGSVKSNIGHAEAASGISQLTKVILQLQHKTLVPSIKANPPNPRLGFEGSPFVLQQTVQEWKRPVFPSPENGGVELEMPLRATVSSFGVGGSNAHVIVEEYTKATTQPARHTASPEVMIFSAKTSERLRETALRMLDYVRSVPNLPLDRFAYTLQVGREAMEARLAFVAADRDQLIGGLEAYLGLPEASGRMKRALFTCDIDTESSDLSSLLASDAGATMAEDLLQKGELEKIAMFWSRGGAVSWDQARKRVAMLRLPTYPFAAERYWLSDRQDSSADSSVLSSESSGSGPSVAKPDAKSRDSVLEWLAVMFARELGLTSEQLKLTADIRNYGPDSILITKLFGSISRRFGVKLNRRDLMAYGSLAALATYIASSSDTASDAAAQSTVRDSGSDRDIAILQKFRDGELTLAETKVILLSEVAPPAKRRRERRDER